MKNKNNQIIILIFVMFISMACAVSKKSAEISDTATPTILPTVTKTCTPVQILEQSATVDVEVGLHLRESPTENSKTIIVLENNDKLVILEMLENGWACVEFVDDSTNETFTGYVNTKYIKFEVTN